MERFDRSYLRKIRYCLQWGLFLFIVYGGFRLYLFREHFLSGSPFVERPPLVDGFLPIGALMGLKLWLMEGIFDPVHPASLVILLSSIVISLAFKKSFCGWICPVGTISEALFEVGRKILGRNVALPRYIDYPLRSIKYLLLFFFFYIVLRMSAQAIGDFLNDPYWKIADIKMLDFFIKMSSFTFYVLLSLVALSLVFKNFWCRYLCPYGALLGLLSVFSPFKINRNEDKCTHCGKCAKNCPALLPVDKKELIRSPECTGCLTCVSGCPARGALDMSVRNKEISPILYIIAIFTVFLGIIIAAKLTGNWQSAVTYDEYKALVPVASKFGHP